MATATENKSLSAPAEKSRELAMSTQSAMAQHEIQGAITVALQFPRNEDQALSKVLKSCGRLAFAEKAAYKFPRGGGQVVGPSCHLAREAARCWGNLRYGFDIIGDDDDKIHLRGFAWDMETNAKATQDAHFKKLIYRKNKGRNATGGQWIVPDERDLRELVNKHGSIAERNCLLKILPPDLTDVAMKAASEAIRKGVTDNIDEHRNQILSAFSAINVTAKDLEAYLDCELRHITPNQVADLRAVYGSIADGNSTWSEYVNKADAEPDLPKGPVSPTDLTNPKGQAEAGPHSRKREPVSSEPNGFQGHVGNFPPDEEMAAQENESDDYRRGYQDAKQGRTRCPFRQDERAVEWGLGFAAATAAAETTAPSVADESADEPLEQYRKRIAEATDIDAVGLVMQDVNSDPLMNDTQYEMLSDKAADREQELRGSA